LNFNFKFLTIVGVVFEGLVIVNVALDVSPTPTLPKFSRTGVAAISSGK